MKFFLTLKVLISADLLTVPLLNEPLIALPLGEYCKTLYFSNGNHL